MDFNAEKQRLEAQFQLISLRASPGQLLWRFDKLRSEFEDTKTTEARRVEIEREIRDIQHRAENAAMGLGAPHPGLSWPTTALIGLAMVLVASLFGLYFWGISNGNQAGFSISATRPLLVMTLIVSMLGLGGLMTARALLSPEGGKDLQDRFRLAREVFLVFAGIFGTIIGFYFGAATGEEDPPPSVSFAVDQSILTAQISGGAPPFVGYVTREGPPLNELMKGSGRLLTVELDPTICPVEATVVIVDGRGRKATADIKNANVLNHPLPDCGERKAEEGDESTEESGNATENAAGDAVDETSQ